MRCVLRCFERPVLLQAIAASSRRQRQMLLKVGDIDLRLEEYEGFVTLLIKQVRNSNRINGCNL